MKKSTSSSQWRNTVSRSCELPRTSNEAGSAQAQSVSAWSSPLHASEKTWRELGEESEGRKGKRNAEKGSIFQELNQDSNSLLGLTQSQRVTSGSVSHHSGFTLPVCSEAKWMSQVCPVLWRLSPHESAGYNMQSKSDDITYQTDRVIVTGGGSRASGSAGRKTAGAGGAEAFMVTCLFFGIDRIRGVAKLILISQVFSSYSGRLSSVAPGEGQDSSQVSDFSVRAVKNLSCSPSELLPFPV